MRISLRRCESFAIPTVHKFFHLSPNTHPKADPGNAKPPLLHLRSGPMLSSDSKIMMHKWLTDCGKKHNTCIKKRKDSQKKNRFLPTRIISIKQGQARLVETEQFTRGKRKATRYIALSHCWGPPTGIEYKTTSQNLGARLYNIEVSELPQNIQDAFLVSQSLGLKYIWIDSMCSMYAPKTFFLFFL